MKVAEKDVMKLYFGYKAKIKRYFYYFNRLLRMAYSFKMLQDDFMKQFDMDCNFIYGFDLSTHLLAQYLSLPYIELHNCLRILGLCSQIE